MNWNQVIVQYDGTTIISHEVSGSVLNPDGSYGIHDQYNPYNKILSSNYLIGNCIQGIVTAVNAPVIIPTPQPQGEMNDTFWTWVMNFWNGIFHPNVGKVGSFRWFYRD